MEKFMKYFFLKFKKFLLLGRSKKKSRAVSRAMHPSNYQRNPIEWMQVGKFTWVQLPSKDIYFRLKGNPLMMNPSHSSSNTSFNSLKWKHRTPYVGNTPRHQSLVRLRIIAKLREERGSLSIFSASLMGLLLVTSFLIINSASAFMAQRELIQIGETALSRAASHLDMNVYYSYGLQSEVPIDCVQAYDSLRSDIQDAQLRGRKISISRWDCGGTRVAAEIETSAKHLISAPVLGMPQDFSVRVLIATHSKVRMS
jgi:hypothetical protein